jgi:signal transduction histidine kinase
MPAAPASLPPAAAPAQATLRAVARGVLLSWMTGRAWRELTYLLAGAALAVITFAGVVAGLAIGALLAVTMLGIAVLAATVSGARQLGAVHRALAAALLGEHVDPPPPRKRQPRLVAEVGSRLANFAGWRAIAYTVASFPLKIVGGYGVAVGLAVGGVTLSYPVAWRVVDARQVGADGVEHRSLMQFGEFYVDTWPRALAVSAIGLMVLLLVPWAVRLVVLVDRLAVRHLLGPGSLSRRVSDLEETRAHAVEDSAATLRRIERDLHAGTQARLVALAMQLDMARERLGAPARRAPTEVRTRLASCSRPPTATPPRRSPSCGT